MYDARHPDESTKNVLGRGEKRKVYEMTLKQPSRGGNGIDFLVLFCFVSAEASKKKSF